MSFREKKEGLIEGRFSFKGQRRSVYGSSKAECQRKARQLLEVEERGEYNPNKVTLSEFMWGWLNDCKSTTVEPSSYARLVSVYENQIKDSIGRKRLCEITTKDIQMLLNDHAKGTNGKKPLAKSGLKKMMHILGPCFRYAVKEGVITKNPCPDVVLPKESNLVVKTKEQFSLSDAEICQFKEAALIRNKKGGIKYRDGICLVLTIALGLRVGELLTVKWSDVFWEGNYIHIHSTLQTGLIGEEKIKIKDGTKSTAGRMISMNENIREYLKMLQEFDEIHGIKSEYIACTTTGTLHDPRNMARSLEKLAERAGLPEEITLHTLRHTFGSSLIRQGIGIEVVSRLLGHANIMITYNKYIHVIKEQEAKAMILATVI